MKRALRNMALIVAVVYPMTGSAQDFNDKPYAAGVRACADGGGVNFRYYGSKMVSVEGQLNVSAGRPGGLPSSSGKSTTGVALVQLHGDLLGPQIRFFIGVGAHYGSWVRYKDVSKSEGLFGFDGIAGIEYMTGRYPLGISLDIKPAFNYVSGVTYFPNNIVGLGVRYYFGKWPKRSGNEKE